MSTRSVIAIVDFEKEEIRSIYCHSDGYLTDVGHILAKYYSTKEKLNSLIQKGGCSYISEKLDEINFYNEGSEDGSQIVKSNFINSDFSAFFEDWAVIVDKKSDDYLQFLSESWIEYIYIFNPEKKSWHILTLNKLALSELELVLNKKIDLEEMFMGKLLLTPENILSFKEFTPLYHSFDWLELNSNDQYSKFQDECISLHLLPEIIYLPAKNVPPDHDVKYCLKSLSFENFMSLSKKCEHNNFKRIFDAYFTTYQTKHEPKSLVDLNSLSLLVELSNTSSLPYKTLQEKFKEQLIFLFDNFVLPGLKNAYADYEDYKGPVLKKFLTLNPHLYLRFTITYDILNLLYAALSWTIHCELTAGFKNTDSFVTLLEKTKYNFDEVVAYAINLYRFMPHLWIMASDKNTQAELNYEPLTTTENVSPVVLQGQKIRNSFLNNRFLLIP